MAVSTAKGKGRIAPRNGVITIRDLAQVGIGLLAPEGNRVSAV